MDAISGINAGKIKKQLKKEEPVWVCARGKRCEMWGPPTTTTTRIETTTTSKPPTTTPTTRAMMFKLVEIGNNRFICCTTYIKGQSTSILVVR
jgi:hypothetical protein